MHINADICTGCGACVEVCPSGSIRLIDGKAVIDEAVCNLCEACVAACPVNAITAAALPVPVEPVPARPVIVTPVPSSSRGVTAWTGAALAFIGREVAPRLADALVNALERRLARAPSQTNRASPQTARAGRPAGLAGSANGKDRREERG
jgi:NAD-dependent dihydropyrimidine dehydrogenase PreA subunit